MLFRSIGNPPKSLHRLPKQGHYIWSLGVLRFWPYGRIGHVSRLDFLWCEMTEPITPDLAYHLKTTSDPNLSPDGSSLAYTLGWVDAETVSNRSQIIVLDLENRSKKELTQGAKDSAPKISSDGLRTAFLRSVDGSPAQVWIIDRKSVV